MQTQMFGTQEMLGMMAVISFQGPASPLGTQPAGTFQATGSLFLAPPLAGASRAAPGKPGLHGRGEGERVFAL